MATTKTTPTSKKGAAPEKSSAASGRVYAETDRLLEPPVTRARIEEAIGRLERHLDAVPGDAPAQWRVARAWVRLLEAQTGTVLEEKKEYYPILEEAGKAALAASERAHDLAPGDPDAIGWHMVSYGYYSVSIGVVKAVLKGAAGKYIALANELNGIDEKWLSGAGWRALGRFYREAPWPKRDLDKSVECFRKAIELGPKRQENKLHLALALADDGETDEAKEILAQVAKSKPEPAESHFHKALVGFAKEKLQKMS